jgi:putative hydrolase of the HAD superfamily
MIDRGSGQQCAVESARGVDVVFFDAAGTLFRVRGSVGTVYSEVAARHGVTADAAELDRAFRHCFADKSAAGLPATGPEAEKAWWRDLVRGVFQTAIPASVFDDYFEDVFDVFRQPGTWMLYEDTVPCLDRLRRSGRRLAVLSNFDSRLDDLLAGLGIARYFETVTLSWRTGVAKPDAGIFRAGLEAMEVKPERALHVGDSPVDDVAGATAAGMQAVLIDRKARYRECRTARRIESLAQLYDLCVEGNQRQ